MKSLLATAALFLTVCIGVAIEGAPKTHSPSKNAGAPAILFVGDSRAE